MQRQKLVRLLRQARLLGAADRVRFLISWWRARESNRRFAASHPNFAIPPSAEAYDAYGHTSLEQYYRSGVALARFVTELIQRHLHDNNIRVLEWGCGGARIIRHLQAQSRVQRLEVFGSDFNTTIVSWCQEHISNAMFVSNKLLPPLSFCDGSFDSVYSISVFTHLSEELQFVWIKELSRVLRTGGIVIFTVHGEACVDHLLPDERTAYNEGSPVVRGQYAEGKRCFVTYHPPMYVDRMIADAGLRLVERITDNLPIDLVQEVWVARKTSSVAFG